jgi:glyoxylase-like metal-dependent hydrolase (beta-lactamase superfamily II)
MQLVFEQIRAGGDRNFGYLLGDRDVSQAVLIDPSYSPETFVARAEEQGLTVTHIINTHGHEDHVNGNATAASLTGAAIAAHPSCPLSRRVDIGRRRADDRSAAAAVHVRARHAPRSRHRY